jgi:hypothetical protein
MAVRMSVKNDLWALAAETLEEDQQTILKSLNTSGGNVVDAVLQQVEQQQKSSIGKEWSFKFRGKEVNVRHLLSNIMEWINKFKDCVDFGVSLDTSGHAAMPWSCVKFFLEVFSLYVSQLSRLTSLKACWT